MDEGLINLHPPWKCYMVSGLEYYKSISLAGTTSGYTTHCKVVSVLIFLIKPCTELFSLQNNIESVKLFLVQIYFESFCKFKKITLIKGE